MQFGDGVILQKNPDQRLTGETDLKEKVRMEVNIDALEQVDKAILERNGKISVTKKQ